MSKLITNDEIKELVKQKRFMIVCFYYSITTNSKDSPKGKSKDSPDDALKIGVTGHFLQAVIMELIIKTLFELNRKKTAPYSHNILNIFNDLDQDIKDALFESFNEARIRKQKIFQRHKISDIQFHPFEKVLKNNESTIKNFKYNAMGSDSNSSLDGIFMTEFFRLLDIKIRELDA